MAYNIAAVIPARKGSQRLVGKNVKIMAGKPMIIYTLQVALGIPCVCVTTDDYDVLEIASAYPYYLRIRPDYLCKSDSSQVDVVMDAVQFLENIGKKIEHVILLQPTSPLRKKKDVDKSIQLYFERQCESLVSVSKPLSHPNFIIDCDKKTLCNIKDDCYFIDGSIYITSIQRLKQEKTFFDEQTQLYMVPKYTSIDVDDEEDFLTAELILRGHYGESTAL